MEKESAAMFDARRCPRCGGRTRVTSAVLKGMDFMRYRKCPKCCYTFKTVELPILYRPMEEYDD